MENLLLIARQILDLNPDASLTGTLMLKLRGIDLGREPHDIDILINNHAPNLEIPQNLNLEDCGYASDGSSQKYKYGDISIDILSSTEEPEIINGWKLGTIERLLDVKYAYYQQNNEASKKHYEDLIKLGFKFPQTYSGDNDGIPF